MLALISACLVTCVIRCDKPVTVLLYSLFSLNYDFTIFYEIFPMGYLEWSRLLIATIEFTILKNSKKNIVNSIEAQLIIF